RCGLCPVTEAARGGDAVRTSVPPHESATSQRGAAQSAPATTSSRKPEPESGIKGKEIGSTI
ncbi:hypothetical protein ABG768_003141, partial [Culter alburnus]